MIKNVRCAPFLTFLALCLAVSCQTDNETSGEVADPEAQYFEDYSGPDRKWGFLDTAGNVIIPPRYDQVSAFSEGLAPVNADGKWGYIDTRDSVIIPFSYRAAWQFHSGVARVIDFSGNPCLIFRDGRTVCPERTLELFDVHEGLAAFQQGETLGYLDTSGVIIIPAQFDGAWGFSGGVARVRLRDHEGLITTNGEFLIPAEYDKVYLPSDHRILVRKDGVSRFLDMRGDRVGQPYAHATPYSGGVAAVADAGGWYLMNLAEQPLFATRYSHLRAAGRGLWIAKQGSMHGVLDNTGTPLTEFKYQQINNYSEGYAGYLRDDLWGFLDSLGNEITPPQYGLVWDFHQGLARAGFRDGIAFITPDGKVPFRPYLEIRDFSEGLAPFQE